MSSDTNGVSQPLRFQVRMWEASVVLITSAARMLLANSWARRWNSRSEPERSIRTSMPGYFNSKALPSLSPTGRSIDEYRITFPSLVAASINCGVIATGSGLAALTEAANAVTPRAAVPLIASRLVMTFRIAPAFCSSLRAQRSNPFVLVALDCFAALAMTALNVEEFLIPGLDRLALLL